MNSIKTNFECECDEIVILTIDFGNIPYEQHKCNDNSIYVFGEYNHRSLDHVFHICFLFRSSQFYEKNDNEGVLLRMRKRDNKSTSH